MISHLARIGKIAHAVGLNTPTKKFLAAAAISAPLALPIGLKMASEYASDDIDICAVNDAVIKESGGRDIYLVFTDCGVYKNVDTMWRLKFNSSDIQAQALKAKRDGHDVAIVSNNWRNRLTSEYPNILSITPELNNP